jgi:flagellar hook-basal body complex protein FliE
MSVGVITPKIPNIAPIKSVPDITPAGPQSASNQGGLSGAFENVLKEVNDLQTQADQQIEGLTLRKDGITPHTAMVALEKADVAFQLMSAIRGKIVRAYEEVMRTQV